MAMTIDTTLSQDPPSPLSPLSPTTESPVTTTADPATANEDAQTVPKSTTSNINTANNIKRKPSRRANTAERRATHNAVERQRRETLNGRFLDLAAILPNLSQIRRPSKSSIVNSSIAHIHASRRHRLLASRELRLLRAESDALRRELNEWRDRAGLPRVEEPVRSEGFVVVVNAEMDAMMISAEMGANHGGMQHHQQQHQHLGGIGEEGELEDGDEDWGMGGGSYDDESSSAGIPANNSVAPPMQQQQAYPGQQAQFAVAAVNNGNHPGYPGHYQGFMDDEGRATAGSINGKGSPFAHSIPRSYAGAGEGQQLFTPPVSRDGPISVNTTNTTNNNNANGNTINNSNSNNGNTNSNNNNHLNSPTMSGGGGASSPTHSVHSVHSMHSTSGRSGSGSPVHHGFMQQQQQHGAAMHHQQAHGMRRAGSGSPGYELTSSSSNSTSSASGPGASYGGSYGGHVMQHHPHGHGYGGHGYGGQGHMMQAGHGHGHAGMGGMVGVGAGGAGAMGGVFGMML